MRFIRIAILATSLIVGAASVAASEDAEFTSALSIAAERHPGLTWEDSLKKTADVNGDGELDQLLIGLGETGYLVAIAISKNGVLELHYLEFGISRVAQRASCGRPIEWESRRRGERPLNALGAYPPGYEGCGECLELVLYDDGGCDPVTIYWDLNGDRPAWWRE